RRQALVPELERESQVRGRPLGEGAHARRRRALGAAHVEREPHHQPAGGVGGEQRAQGLEIAPAPHAPDHPQPLRRDAELFAHRGASGLIPENTLDAFAAGLKTGAERLELDVHATSDGVVVVLHDETLERTTDGTGPVRALSLAVVARLDAGYRFRAPDGTYPYRDRGLGVPTLAALLEAFPGVPLNIELKQQEPPIEAAVLATL